MKHLYLLICLLPFFTTTASAERNLSLHSPSSRLLLEIHSASSGHSLLLKDKADDLARIEIGMQLGENTWTLSQSEDIKLKSKRGKGPFKEYLLSTADTDLRVRFRMFDNAVAFRYEGSNKSPMHLQRELSSWTLASDTRIWYFERRNAWKLKSYAGTWEESSLKNMSDVVSSPVQGTPIVFQLPNGKYGFISEAALSAYSGLRLMLKDNTFSADFTEGQKGFELPASFVTPWRVFFVGDDLDALVNQKVIRDLNPRPDKDLYADCSYIKPGKSVWRWFCHGTGTPAQEREMIDAAAKLNFTYTTIDDGWKQWENKWDKVRELANYARPKNVRLFLWFNSHPLQNPENDYESMRHLLDSVALYGAAGVKVDFMDSEAKRLIDFEMKLLQECAKRKLLVNFHGCHKSTGENYCYPNEVTREGIRGLELNKMGEGYITAAHNAALPFTRFVVGHADYTPLSFTVPGATTFAHQLATLVCFDSYMQTIAESPFLLLNEPRVQPALKLIREVPTVWDEVKVLPQSEIGKLAVLAKRSGNSWYIGILNGESQEKEVQLDLSGLCKGQPMVEAYVDDLQTDKVILDMKGHRPGVLRREPSVPFKVVKEYAAVQSLHLAPHGGAVIVLHNKK